MTLEIFLELVDETTATRKIVTKSNLLEVPKFSGKLEDWPAFWEAFRILVHETGDENIYKRELSLDRQTHFTILLIE